MKLIKITTQANPHMHRHTACLYQIFLVADVASFPAYSNLMKVSGKLHAKSIEWNFKRNIFICTIPIKFRLL